MVEIDITPMHDAMDKSFKYAGDQWSEDFHKNLQLPGIFKKLLQNDTAKDPKTGIRMDILELVEIDEKQEILINIEHQSIILDKIKIEIIDGYKNNSKCQHKLPLLTVIVSPFPKERHITEYRSTESDVLQPVFITIDNDEIKKRLNILKRNIQNKELENAVVLNIAIISIFVLENKYKILKELCEVLTQSIGITGKIKRDMTKILEEMIKYKLQDNETQVRELLSMIDEEIEIAKRGIKIWYAEEFEQIETQHKKELAQKDAELTKKDAELTNKDAELTNKDAQYQKELAQKDKKIAELNALLKTNGIT